MSSVKATSDAFVCAFASREPYRIELMVVCDYEGAAA